MAVLLIAEVTKGVLGLDSTAKALTAASQLGEVHLLIASDSPGAAEEAAKLEGVSKVLTASDPAYANTLAEPVANLVVRLAEDYTHIAAPALVNAKNVLPRAAALLDVMVITDVQEIVDENTFVRPIYAGNAIQTVTSSDRI